MWTDGVDGELAKLRRRVRYFEAVMASAIGRDRQVREFFTAAELVDLSLPGLPDTARQLARQAAAERWSTDPNDTRSGGGRCRYHVSSLPTAAFERLLEKLAQPKPSSGWPARGAPAPTPEQARPLRQRSRELRMRKSPASLPGSPGQHFEADNTTPPWLLPLLRALRTQRKGLAEAVASIPERALAGAVRPTLPDARAALAAIGWEPA